MSSTVSSNEGNGKTVLSDGNVRVDTHTDGIAGAGVEEDQSTQRGGPFNLNDTQKRILLAVIVAHLIIAKLTWRDLRRRPDVAVRGPKGLWRTWSFLNTTGSLAYWTIGRRRVRASEIETSLA
jgi:hypothetical protein